MKPYGLTSGDLSSHPGCPCCSTKYHSKYSNHCAFTAKTDTRRACKKRGRQAAKMEIKCQS